MTNPQLPGSASRGRTYAVMASVLSVALVLSVGLPLLLADRPDTVAAESGSSEFAVPEGAAADAGPDGGLPADSAAPDATAAAGSGDAAGAAGASGDAGEAAAGSAGADSGTPAQGGGGAPAQGGGGTPAQGGAGGSPAGQASGMTTSKRTASDQGVTADTIKLGVFVIDFAGANGAGATYTGYNVSQQKQLAQAFADETNSKGGVGGRKLVLAFRTVDILNQQTMRDACTNFARTDKVFAVTQVLGVYGDPILICARDFKLPYLANDGAVSGYYGASRGYVFTTQPSTLRTQVTLVRQLVRLGELKGKKVGFLYEDGYLLPDNDATIAELKRNGVDPVRGVTSSSDVPKAVRQIPAIARDMCSKGVDYVLYAVNSIYGAQFAENMTRFGCRPAYAVSDFDFTMNGDAFPQDMPDAWFDRALSVTASRTGEGRVGKTEPAHDRACIAVLQRRTGQRPDRNTPENSNYSAAVDVCTLQELFVRGVQGAGVNPTRAAFASALARTGAFNNGNYGPSSFRPGRTDAPDAVRITRGELSCKCWKPQTDFFAAR